MVRRDRSRIEVGSVALCDGKRRGCARRAAGFTLIELMFVVAIIGGLLVASTFGLRMVLRTDLRSAASKSGSAMRFAFDQAMMTGSYLRLAIDLERGELWLERLRPARLR